MKIHTISKILLLCLLSSSCLHENLDGHWRLQSLDPDKDLGTLQDFLTLDIYADSMVVLGRNCGDAQGIAGAIDYFRDRMIFGGEDIFYEFKYNHQGDFMEIWMEENGKTYNLAAIRCDQECCITQKDFIK